LELRQTLRDESFFAVAQEGPGMLPRTRYEFSARIAKDSCPQDYCADDDNKPDVLLIAFHNISSYCIQPANITYRSITHCMTKGCFLFANPGDFV
jgi:hypothetical protein